MSKFEIGDVIVYGMDGLCKVEDITEKKFGKEIIRYYVLRKLSNHESVNYIPVDNEKSLSKMRHILTKEQILKLIEAMPVEATPWTDNDRERQQEFKDTILYGDSSELISVLRTLYLHQEEQVDKGKKLHIADERFFKEAEKVVFEEIAYVFDIPENKVFDFISKSLDERAKAEK